MSEDTKVEVILPVYNPSSLVKEAIVSVIDQTFKNCHLTIIDDASPDRKKIKKLKRYIKDRNKISYYSLEENKGAGTVRNIAAKKTDAEYISFIDQDDRYVNDKVENQIKKLKKSDAHLIHGNIIHIDEKGNRLKEGPGNTRRNRISYIELLKKKLARELFKVNSLRIGTVMLDRNAFLEAGGFDPNLFGGEEWEFWVRFALNYKITHTSEIIYEKRIHEKQVSITHAKERLYGQLQAVEKMENNFDFLDDLADDKRRGFVRKIAKQEILDGNDGKARDLIKENFLKINANYKDYLLLYLTYFSKLNKWLLHKYLTIH